MKLKVVAVFEGQIAFITFLKSIFVFDFNQFSLAFLIASVFEFNSRIFAPTGYYSLFHFSLVGVYLRALLSMVYLFCYKFKRNKFWFSTYFA